MPFFEINLSEPTSGEVQKIAVEGRDNIEAYEVALRKTKGTTFNVPSPGDFEEIDFKRALLIARGKLSGSISNSKSSDYTVSQKSLLS